MAEEVKIDITVSAGKGQKTVKDFKKDIEGVGTAAKKMGSDLKVGLDVRQRLRDLQNRMAEIGDVGSKEFQNLAREAGGLKDQMNNANAAIKSMSADFPKLQLGVQGLQAMGAASQATVAAQALLGTENEEVTKSIQKMMALQAVSNSLMQFSNLLSDESALGLAWRKTGLFRLTKQIKSYNIMQKIQNGLMKAFNFITGKNPLVKMIVILAAVAAGFVWLGKNVKAVGDFFIWMRDLAVGALNGIMSFFGFEGEAIETNSMKERKAAAEKKKQHEENARQNTERLEAIKKEFALLEEKNKKEQAAFDLEIKINKLLGKSTDELTTKKLENNLQWAEDQKEKTLEALESWVSYYEKEFILSGKSMDDFKAMMKGRGIDIELLEIEKVRLTKEADDRIRLASAELTSFKISNHKKVADSKVKHTKESLDIIEKLENAYTDSLLDNQTRQENAIRDKYFAAIELARANGIDTTLLEEAQLQELTDIRAKFKQQEQDVLDEMQDEFDAIELEKEKEKQLKKQQIKEAAFQSAEALLSAAESLNTIFHGKELKRIEAKKKRGEKLTASEEKRLAKEAKIQKAFALVQIAIDTAKAIAGAVAAGASQPFPLNIAAIISGVAAVLANVAAASELMSAPPPSISASGGGDIADLTEDASQDAPVQALTEGSTLLNNEVQQVVVVESITDGINSVGVIEAQASFG